LDIPWGWKDPRNTYTLPIWLDLFPEAKVIHIYRHGVDVASSLQVRHRKDFAHFKPLHDQRKRLYLYWLQPKRKGFATLRSASLEGGFSLWEAYMVQSQAHLSRLSQQRAIELKYEDFITEPLPALTELVHFCGLSTDASAIVSVAGMVKAERVYAYQSDPELQAFANQVGERLNMRGYRLTDG